MSLFNYYSFAIVLLVIWGIITGLMLRSGSVTWRDYLAVVIVGALLFGAWAVLHPRQSELSADAEAVRAEIGAGTPVLLEFQSPYCLACTAMYPLVDRVEEEYAGRLRVIRVNIQSSAGRELTKFYGFEYTPTFIFFDAAGQEIWRQVGGLDEDRLRSSLNP